MRAFFLVLFLVESAEGVDIAGAGDTREGALALPIQLELALDLLDNHLFQREYVQFLHVVFGLGGRSDIAVQVELVRPRSAPAKRLGLESVVDKLALDCLATLGGRRHLRGLLLGRGSRRAR